MTVTFKWKERFNILTSKDTVKLIIDALEDKKAENIQIIDISEISSVADYFVITNGTNRSQVQALADNVEEKLDKEGIYPKQIEGYSNANWILLDYADIVIHVFDRESRGFYDLERIWRDGNLIAVNEFA